MVKKNSIPERWRCLRAVGVRVPGSRFIAFKVPLKGATSQRVTQNQKFTPKDLLTTIRNQNEELGLIIDLTNTERYYTTKDLPRSVQYVKLHTAGLKIPDDATIHQFKRVVRRFLFAHEDDDKIIGVHCTTGINRTGYLICRYLIDIDGWVPIQSLSAFGQSRGHPIDGSVYIEDLVKGPQRSNVGIDLPPTEEERAALDSGLGEIPRDRAHRSIMDSSNEFGDFDARDQKTLPQELPENFPDEPRGGRAPGRNILGDHDLRIPLETQREGYMNDGPMNMYPPERFRRLNPHMEGRFNPGPRPLMDIQDDFGPRMMQRPFENTEMGGEDMDFDLRGRGPQNLMQAREQFDSNYPRPLPPYARNQMPNPMYQEEEEEEYENEYPYEEESYNEEYYEEGQGYDTEEMGDSYQGPVNERMNPNARYLEGPMNDRMRPRDPRFMNVQGREGPPMNARIPPRPAPFMEGPRNAPYLQGLVNPRGITNVRNESDFSGNEGPVIKRMQPTVGRLMDLPVNANQGDRQHVAGLMPLRGVSKPMYGRMPMPGLRALNEPVNDKEYTGDSENMDDPRMFPRNAKPFGGPVNFPRNSRAMNMSMNLRMPQRDHTMDGTMSNKMFPSDPRGMGGPMTDRMQPEGDWTYDATEGPMNEAMHPRDNKFAMTKPRPAEGPMSQDYPGDARPFEGRNVNAPAEPRKRQSRFSPYYPLKPLPTPLSMGPPRNDQHNMGLPAHGYKDGYPPRNQLN